MQTGKVYYLGIYEYGLFINPVQCFGAPDYPDLVRKGMHDLISPDFEESLNKMTKYEYMETYQSMAEMVGFQVKQVGIFPWDEWFESTDQFIRFWVGVMGGNFNLDSVDKLTLQKFKTEHEEELKATPMKADILCMEVKKTVVQDCV